MKPQFKKAALAVVALVMSVSADAGVSSKVIARRAINDRSVKSRREIQVSIKNPSGKGYKLSSGVKRKPIHGRVVRKVLKAKSARGVK